MGCSQQYQAEKIVEQATWTSSNNIKSWYSSKEGFVISLVGLQRNCLFWTLTTQPNDQFCCLHWTTNEIKQCSWRKAARIDKSKRCCIPSWQCKTTHIFGHSAKIIGPWLDVLPPYSPDLAPSDYFLFRSLQNSLNGKNFNNNDDIKSYLIHTSFLLIKTRSFMNVGLWCCLKDGKRSLIKMGNTLQNKVI